MTPQITQVIRRTAQGATRPFICRADDGFTYYVKGKSASTGERIREWMGAQLATAFGLPVPVMRILEVPEVLMHLGNQEIVRDLGAGYVVGSRQVSTVNELRHDEVASTPVGLQQIIVLFDYWVQNEDRTLSALGGNPNLLWDKADQQLYAIDYNLILPDDFDAVLFWRTHVFRDAFSQALSTTDKQGFEQKLQSALQHWQAAWCQIPEAWLDENQTTHAFDEKSVLKRLKADAQGALWSRFKP